MLNSSLLLSNDHNALTLGTGMHLHLPLESAQGTVATLLLLLLLDSHKALTFDTGMSTPACTITFLKQRSLCSLQSAYLGHWDVNTSVHLHLLQEVV